MNIEITQKPNIKLKIKDLDMPAGLMKRICMNMRSRMIDRVQKDNKDIKGTKFEKYSDATKKAKAKLGRGSKVDLTDRGTMMKSIQFKASKNVGEFYMADRKKVGMYHQYGMGQPKREWFGYSKDSEEKARKEYKNKLNPRVQR